VGFSVGGVGAQGSGCKAPRPPSPIGVVWSLRFRVWGLGVQGSGCKDSW